MNTEAQHENIGYTVEEILEIVKDLGGVPVLFKPSFVMGGKQIECRENKDLAARADEAWQISPSSEVWVEKLI